MSEWVRCKAAELLAILTYCLERGLWRCRYEAYDGANTGAYFVAAPQREQAAPQHNSNFVCFCVRLALLFVTKSEPDGNAADCPLSHAVYMRKFSSIPKYGLFLLFIFTPYT